MKLEKVKIQAFRAYDTVENGTFDFCVAGKGHADFVSLYAPNGFGKTSFYDAVEFAFTNSISRFTRTGINQDASKSQKVAAKGIEDKQFVLRNKFSAAALNTFVEVYTGDSNVPITRNVELPRKGSVDFDFSGKKAVNKYFTEVVLAQEWIDAFLLVDNAEDRYEKFVQYFGDKDLHCYFKKLVELSNANEKQIDALQDDIKKLAKDLDFAGDKEVLSKVNASIAALAKSGESLQQVDENFSEKQSLAFANQISHRLNDIAKEQQSLEQKLSELNILDTGSKISAGIETYYKTQEQKQSLEKEKAALEKIVGLFNELGKNENQEKAILENITTLESVKRAQQDILQKMDSYLLLQKVKNKLEADIKSVEKTKLDAAKKVKDASVKHGATKASIDQINEQIATLEQSLKDIASLNETNSKNKTTADQLQKNITALNAAIKSLTEQKAYLALTVQACSKAISLNKAGKFPNTSDAVFKEFEKQIEALKTESQAVSDLETQLKILNGAIKKQEAFNEELEDFIARGAAIADEAQLSACPLCSHDYKTYAALSASIASNELLSELMKGLLAQRSTLESALKKLQAQIKKQQDKYSTDLQKKYAALQNSLLDLDATIEKNKADKKKTEQSLKQVSDAVKNYQKSLVVQSYDVYVKNIQDQLTKLHTDSKAPATALKEQSKLLQAAKTAQKQAENTLQALQDSMVKLLKDKTYATVLAFLAAHFPKTTAPQKSLQLIIAATDKKINTEHSALKKLRLQIASLKKAIESHALKSTSAQLTELTKTLTSIQAVILDVERRAAALLKVKIAHLTKAALQKIITTRRNEISGQIEDMVSLASRFLLLADLRKNVEPYLKFQKAKTEEEALLTRIGFLERTVQQYLHTERSRVIEHLDKQINSFFYQDLINDLYSRIDPHPDYKKVRFICDFNEDKPRLNVCLYQSAQSGSPIIPNLYFSTAQLNILSLSIFLAKALNTKDEKGKPINCIFIDDPIQSMDGINILSTIDLFRSIVLNQQKQIILSTHDHNFHNLLKKKMPPQYFKSKFLELETFGKVRQETFDN